MAPFPKSYAVLHEIEALVKGHEGAADFIDMMLKLAPAKARMNTDTYHLSFTTKLFLEEAVGISKKFDQYNMRDTAIEYVSNETFRFKIVVRTAFIASTFYS